jgi:vacuolar iron transporter family protein
VRTQGLGRVSYGPAVVVLAFRRPLMPQTAHAERHFTAGDAVRDVVIGMSDGITVPFALTAGLSGAVSSTGVVVVAGLAEVAAGAIAMGLDGYLAARSDAEHYASERAREVAETGAKPAAEAAEVSHILRAFGLTAEESAPIVAALRRRPEAWVDFMMRFELGLENPDPRRALTSALTIGSAYVVGGLIPLAPYMAFATIPIALKASVASRLWRSGSSVGSRHALPERAPLRSALQTMLIGGTAAAAAFAIYRLDSSRRRSLAAGHSVRSRNRATIRGSPLTPYMNEDLQRQH